jgi:hypothetical protein
MRLLRHLLHLLPRASKLLGSLASWLCAGLLKLKSPLRRAFFMAKSQGNWGQIPINSRSSRPFHWARFVKKSRKSSPQGTGVRFQLIHALAARHGDSFFWSFAQKMVPRPCGFTVIFA